MSALLDVQAERKRQERRCAEKRAEGFRWHSCADAHGLSDPERLAVLVEEIGEVADAVNELRAGHGTATLAHLREELVQVAAVALAWIEGLDAEWLGDAS